MSTQNFRLLVVDDNLVDRDLVRRLGKELGWAIQEAGSLGEMSSILQAGAAGLGCVIASTALPDGDGFAALTAAKGIHPDLPVLIVTAADEPELGPRLLRAGASACLAKDGLSAESLMDAVRRAGPSNGEWFRRFETLQLSEHELMRIICHDLRNPLSAIILNATILSRDGAMAEDRRTKVAHRILSSATRMNRMLEELHNRAQAPST